MQNAARSSEPGSVRAGPRTGGFVRSDRPGSPRVAPLLSLGSLVEPTRVPPIRGTRVRIALPLPPHNPLAPRASDALVRASEGTTERHVEGRAQISLSWPKISRGIRGLIPLGGFHVSRAPAPRGDLMRLVSRGDEAGAHLGRTRIWMGENPTNIRPFTILSELAF